MSFDEVLLYKVEGKRDCENVSVRAVEREIQYECGHNTFSKAPRWDAEIFLGARSAHYASRFVQREYESPKQQKKREGIYCDVYCSTAVVAKEKDRCPKYRAENFA